MVSTPTQDGLSMTKPLQGRPSGPRPAAEASTAIDNDPTSSGNELIAALVALFEDAAPTAIHCDSEDAHEDGRSYRHKFPFFGPGSYIRY